MADAENITLTTGCTLYTGGRHSCLLTGVPPRKLLKSHSGCCFLVLPECKDLFYALCLLMPPQIKVKCVKSGECGDPKLCLNILPLRTSRRASQLVSAV